MADLVVVEQAVEIPSEWDYEESVGRCRNLFKEVREKGAEALIELRIAHELLTEDSKKKIGRRWSDKTFETYCEDIGVHVNTGHNWLHRYFPDYLPKRISQICDIPPPEGRYRTIIIDPPWPMAKIEREVRPRQQTNLDYTIMTLEQIKDKVAQRLSENVAEDGCHIYLWATHRFVPDAFQMFDVWGVNYECLLTWRKNVGFTPYSWMYSTEHCLFGRIGNLKLLELGRRLDFDGKVKEHSRKPDEFYDLVRVVSPEPRLDLFSREDRHGFEGWGLEKGKFNVLSR